MAAPQASLNPLWPAIYWFGLPNALFTPVAGIRLQRARDATASLVDPTGTTTTENGICADALETHGTVVFARLLKHIKPWPRYQHLVFCSCWKSLSFHVSLPEDQLLLQLNTNFHTELRLQPTHTLLLAFLPLSPNRARGVLSSPAGRAGVTSHRYRSPGRSSYRIAVKLGGDESWGRISDEFVHGRCGSLIKRLMS